MLVGETVKEYEIIDVFLEKREKRNERKNKSQRVEKDRLVGREIAGEKGGFPFSDSTIRKFFFYN